MQIGSTPIEPRRHDKLYLVEEAGQGVELDQS
jgi:hypothetical protein